MHTFAIVTAEALLIARRGRSGPVETHLNGKAPECLAVDPADPARLYCGTWGFGLWRSVDGGRRWSPAGADISQDVIPSAACVPGPEGDPSLVYVGTQPSAIYRSADGGETWQALPELQALPSAGSWSFPPQPSTHHVRWLEPDPAVPERLYAAIEAGALVRTLDGGETWLDRVPGGPYDTHTAAAHPNQAGFIASAAGDGYYESHDGGETWVREMAGLRHGYLVGLAVDPADPGTVLVSAASSPRVAYTSRVAEAYVYRKTAGAPFRLAMAGLPAAQGSTVSRFVWTAQEPGVVYAANNQGLYQSVDEGRSWVDMDIPWPEGPLGRGAKMLQVILTKI